MTTNKGGSLTYLASSGMELCWLQAWLSFLLLSVFNLRAPILFSIALFFGGSLSTRFCFRKKRLVIQVLLIHWITFTLIFFTTIQLFIFKFNNHPEQLAFHRLISPDKGGWDWLLIVLLVVVSIMIWKRGSIAVSKPLDSSNMYNRFDLGITAFVLLLIIESMITVRFETSLRMQAAEIQYIPFFLLGLLSISLTLVSLKDNRSFAAGFHKAGIALGFSFLVLMAGVSIVLLFSPQLSTTAEALSVILKKAGAPVGQVLISIIRFMWGTKRSANAASAQVSASQNSGLNLGGNSSEGGVFHEIIKWSLIALLIIVSLTVLFVTIRLIIKLLLRESRSTDRIGITHWSFPRWILKIKMFLKACIKWIIGHYQKPDSAREFYAILVKWGKSSGTQLQVSETPLEYGYRLAGNFPILEKQIFQLTNLINQEIYGNHLLTPEQKYNARCTQKRLSLPIYWPMRLKAWFISN